MANNRMYLRCRKCGEILFLGKCYLDGYFYGHYDGESLEQKLNDFYNKHDFCDAPLNKEEIKSLDTPFKQNDSYYNRYEIAYEFEDEANTSYIDTLKTCIKLLKQEGSDTKQQVLEKLEELVK